jgi:NADH-quinone oxidoreductase subunit N
MIPFVPAFTPFLILALTPIVMMIAICIGRRHSVNTFIALLGVFLSYESVLHTPSLLEGSALSNLAAHRYLLDLFVFDAFNIYFVKLILLVGFLLLIFSHYYIDRNQYDTDGPKEEFAMILMISLLGATLLVCSKNMMSFFLSLELMTIPLYGLMAYFKSKQRSLEAAIKYLTLASASTAFILMGLAFFYAAFGSMDFYQIAGLFSTTGTPYLPIVGIIFILSGIGFKLSAAPFHMWAGDVYEGSPTPVTAYIATVSKGAVIAFFSKLTLLFHFSDYTLFQSSLTLLAVLSMGVGNLLALKQRGMKRLLAYSSVAHMGFILVAISLGEQGQQTVILYVTSYILTVLTAFCLLGLMSSKLQTPYSLEDLKGLFWHSPYKASILMICLLSFMGIPLTAGFLAKYSVFLLAYKQQSWFLFPIMIINSLIALGYYLKFIFTMLHLDHHPESVQVPQSPPKALTFSDIFEHVLIGVLTLGILYIGTFPSRMIYLLDYIKSGPSYLF